MKLLTTIILIVVLACSLYEGRSTKQTSVQNYVSIRGQIMFSHQRD